MRPALAALYAFQAEVGRTREAVSEPMLGLIRLQWWRETVDGAFAGTPRRHDVAETLAAGLAGTGWARADFERIIEARAQDLEETGPEDLAALEAYARDTGGATQQLAMDLFAGDAAAREAAAGVGTAWSLVGLLRALAYHARWRKVFVPRAVLARHGLVPEDVIRGRHSPAMAAALGELAGRAREHLGAAREVRVSRAHLPPLLLAPLAERYLRALEARDFDSFSGPVALGGLVRPAAVWTARLRGRI